jgi:hypothetical protein
VIPYLVAAVVHHSTWIADNLNESHPLFLSRCWRQGNQESLKPYVLAPTHMSCSDTGMQATGIPPTYVFMHSQSELNKNVIDAIEKGSNQVAYLPRTSTGSSIF